MTEFVPFKKIPRLARDCCVTEKIDGTNGIVSIRPVPVNGYEFGVDTEITVNGAAAYIRAGSRTRWIAPGPTDNAGFAAWVRANAHNLAELGVGTHYGEWWGSGIQRGYGLPKGEKRFSLFNVGRWLPFGACFDVDEKARPVPECCHVVPMIYTGEFDSGMITNCVKELVRSGSKAAPGFMDPEGVVIYHTAANAYFKKTVTKDEEWKGRWVTA